MCRLYRERAEEIVSLMPSVPTLLDALLALRELKRCVRILRAQERLLKLIVTGQYNELLTVVADHTDVHAAKDVPVGHLREQIVRNELRQIESDDKAQVCMLHRALCAQTSSGLLALFFILGSVCK